MFMDATQKYFPSYPDYNEDWSSCKEYITLPVTPEIDMTHRRKISGHFVEEIKKIVKVHNPYLYSHFLIKNAEYETRGSVDVKELYHDTAESNVHSILTTNLDWRQVRRAKYGRGVSFSPSPEYANKWSSLSNGTCRAMIIADVLIGKKKYVYTSHSYPPDDCDTTVSSDSNVYVKYYDNEFYPKYVVYYRSRPQPPRPRFRRYRF